MDVCPTTQHLTVTMSSFPPKPFKFPRRFTLAVASTALLAAVWAFRPLPSPAVPELPMSEPVLKAPTNSIPELNQSAFLGLLRPPPPPAPPPKPPPPRQEPPAPPAPPPPPPRLILIAILSDSTEVPALAALYDPDLDTMLFASPGQFLPNGLRVDRVEASYIILTTSGTSFVTLHLDHPARP